jgi:hypothetical protein
MEEFLAVNGRNPKHPVFKAGAWLGDSFQVYTARAAGRALLGGRTVAVTVRSRCSARRELCGLSEEKPETQPWSLDVSSEPRLGTLRFLL